MKKPLSCMWAWRALTAAEWSSWALAMSDPVNTANANASATAPAIHTRLFIACPPLPLFNGP